MAGLKGNYGKATFLAIFLVGLFTVSSLLVLVSTGATGESGDMELNDQPTGPTRLSGTLSLKDQGATQKFRHTSNYAYMGSAVVSGDVNGDGADDIIIGARGASSYTGEILIYFGMISTAPDMTDTQADVKINAPSGARYYGESIGVGDVDGDGIEDIISGSMYGSSNRGEAYIHFGSRAWKKGTTVASPDVIFKGQAGSSSSVYFGMDVWVEDMDGDGVSDVIAVEPNYNQGYVQERWKGSSYYLNNYTGLCFIFFGRSRTEWGAKGVTYDLNSGLPTNTVRIKGWAPYSSGSRRAYIGYYAGQALGTGDFNGDRINDLAIGGYQTYAGSSYPYAGATTVIFGMNRTNWFKWGGEYDLLARQGEYMFFTNAQSYTYTGYNPRFGDLNGDGFDDLITCSYYGSGSYEGVVWVIFGTNDTTRLNTLMKTMQGSWPTGGYYNYYNNVADFKFQGDQTYSYGAQAWADDFDGDGKDDLLIGAGGTNVGSFYYAGKVYLFYGKTTAQWKSKFQWGFGDSDWVAEGEGQYAYLGYYYYQTLGSGDFDNNGVADLLLGSPMQGGSYFGACYMLLPSPPELKLGKFDIVDADGFDKKTVLPETGGAPTSEKATNLTGDGVYTFNGNLTDSWTVNEVQELRVIISLRGVQMGVQYSFGYGLANGTFFTINNPAKGMSLVKEQSNFQYLGFQSAEFNLSVKFHLTFLNQEPFDVIYQAVRKSGITEIRLEERLHLEKDLVLEGTDFYVTRDGAEVHRGDYLAVGGPLHVTGMRIVHAGTIVSPGDDKFFVRVFDSYSRIFEDRSSSGRQIMTEIPMSVDSGIYKFFMDVILSEYAAQYMTVTAVVPAFYLQLDFMGPERPNNVRFHSDSLVDPEGRWDNDLGVWVTWDPSFDTQQGVVGYHVEVSGPAYKGEFYTDGLSMNLTFPEAGTYVVMVRGEDESGNIGLPGSARIVVDMSEIRLLDAYPSYHGGVWYKDSGMEVLVTVDDVVPSSVGPGIDLTTLEYALTGEMSLSARDGAKWVRPVSYRVVEVRKEQGGHVLTTVSVPVEVMEGQSNYLWFRVNDSAGNSGRTGIVTGDGGWTDALREEANRTNPSNVWVDLRTVTFTDAQPDPDAGPLDESLVVASIRVRDLKGSGVDASSVQYSVSRNGLGNYGGWTTVTGVKDGETVEGRTGSALLFEPGSVNYVRWRGKDIAGNGYTVSDDYMIVVRPRLTNGAPEAVITRPVMNQVHMTTDVEAIVFDGSDSSDPDGDALSFEWVLANKTVLSRADQFEVKASWLGSGVHVVTMYVTDGRYTVTDSISIYIRKDPSEVDTDRDGLVDGIDEDDDNDLLDDLMEVLKGTNPRLWDTDGDGVSDKLDAEPLNNEVTSKEGEQEYSYWEVLLLVILLSTLVIGIGAMVVLKRRSTMERNRIVRSVAQEGRIVTRYEALTGIEAPLLPQVKEMGLSLPPVAAQQVAPVRRAAKLGETPNLPMKREAPVSEPRPVPAPEPRKEPVPSPAPEPRPVPPSKEPGPRRRVRRRGEEGAASPGEVPTAEKLMSTQALPGEKAAEAGKVTCDLCGSSIVVPAGAAGTVECPLCGEKKAI